MRSLLAALFGLALFGVERSSAALTDSSLETHIGSLALSFSFDPVKAAYWTGLPHHRRTPFAVSPDGTSAYLAYLDASGAGVHIQPVSPTTFAANGTAVTVAAGMEAGGLVAHNDGFALLTNEALASGTADAPSGSTPVPVVYRFTDGQQTWKTFIGGPDVDTDFGLEASPDINGDLVYSEEAGYYAAYIVVTAYTGDAAGHFGDAIRYLTSTGELQDISGASSDWGCSHNTGIAFEEADAPPYASICAEDQGAIWLNTKTQGMTNDGVKISNEHTINGASNEPMGGMSGSYSGLARFIGEDSYIFSWVSRGAINLTENTWMGPGYTKAENRTNNRNVAIALFTDKYTLVGPQATSEVGATSGDSQINWVTQGTADCSNAHAAAFSSSQALITWEEIIDPSCQFDAMGCSGIFSGTFYQLVDDTGAKIGDPLKSTDTYVAGDMVTISDGRICWPYVSMDWRLDLPVGGGLPDTTTQSVSFACMNLDGTSGEQSGATSLTVPASSATASGMTPSSSSSDSPPASSPSDPPLQSSSSSDPPAASSSPSDPPPASYSSSNPLLATSDPGNKWQVPPTSSAVPPISSATYPEVTPTPSVPATVASSAAAVSSDNRFPSRFSYLYFTCILIALLP